MVILMTTTCNPNDTEPILNKTTPKEVVVEVSPPKVNYKKILEEDHMFLAFDRHYSVTSIFGDFGEEVTFLPDRVNGDLIVAKGSYSSGVLFYRIYNIAFDKLQIIYEVTNEQKNLYEQFEKSEDVFSFGKEKPTTLLEMPYEVGHTWEDGSITAIYEIEGEHFIEVTYKNHNKIIFSDQKGVKEIHYTLPLELQEIYEGVTEDVIVAK